MIASCLLAWIAAVRDGRADSDAIRRRLAHVSPSGVAAALEDMAQRWPDRIDPAPAWLGALAADRDALLARLKAGDAAAATDAALLLNRVRDALLALPLLDVDRLLAVRRGANNLALPANWDNLHEINRDGLSNQIVILSNLRGQPALETLWQPKIPQAYAGQLALRWDARRLMFTSNNDQGRYRVFELDLAQPGAPAREIRQISDDDVDNYAGCWLPDGDTLFLSTASMIGVPCVRGASHVGHLFRTEGHAIRRLTFDQDHNWYPTLLADGRVMYLRWEYSDIPHFVSRILFTMNPDGTGQRAHYGSNSYWPNALFYARPIPDHPHRFAAIVSGHHGTHRAGELIVFDPTLGRFEADGVVQRIPGRGQPVVPVIEDYLVDKVWPRFLTPWPLGNNYILVACQLDAQAPWGLYLVDLFDNITLIYEEPGQAMLEPMLLEPRPAPPVMPSQVRPGAPALLKIMDVYEGPGLAGIPRGTVKALRVFSYAFSYRGMGGQVDRVGLDGPWDVRRVLGTVPVEADGSAYFEAPAKTPIAFQPLDADGRALQLMRSWALVMPGELQSCSGCHEPQNSGPGPLRRIAALARPPSQIQPWHGPTRGFSFNREVQPVLDRHCVRCHDGREESRPDFTLRPMVPAGSACPGYNDVARFPPAYLALRAHVRGHTLESDMHLLTPCEFHANTTSLVRMLEQGHHGVRLDPESWDRINTWIDMNTPAHGTWSEISGDMRTSHIAARRREMLNRYAGIDEDPEDFVFRAAYRPPTPPALDPSAPPFVPEAPRREPAQIVLDASAALPAEQRLDLGDGAALRLVQAPAGSLVTSRSERHVFPRPFWVSAHEIRNRDYARFDPAHDSRIESGDFLQFSARERGYPCNLPDQPVCRISRDRAAAFCEWLSARTGRRVRLPTAAEWEWVARAGLEAASPWSANPDVFAKTANLADQSLRRVNTYDWGLPSGAVPPHRPAHPHVCDGHRVSAPVGSFEANAWGLFDALGNTWEWLADTTPDGRALARGGSWYTPPAQTDFDVFVRYPAWQQVYDVGFRVVVEIE